MVNIRIHLCIFKFLCLVLLGLELVISAVSLDACRELEKAYENLSLQFDNRNSSKIFINPNAHGSEDNQGKCGSEEFPCKSISQALEIRNLTIQSNSPQTRASANAIELILSSGSHSLDTGIRFVDSSWIQIRGQQPERTFLQCSNFIPNSTCFFNDLAFTESRYVRIVNVTFTNCGPIAGGLFFRNVTDSIIEDCVFESNTATAIYARNFSNLYFIHNEFHNNLVTKLPPKQRNSYNASNSSCRYLFETNLFLNSSAPTASGVSLFSEFQEPSNILIMDSKFENNTAELFVNFENIPTVLQPYGRGGAIAVVLKDTNGDTCVKGCEIKENRASITGGGLAYSITNPQNSSSLKIQDSVFVENDCLNPEQTCRGGAIFYQSEGTLNDLTVSMTNVTFKNNKGDIGGGVSFSMMNNVDLDLVNCRFERNMANGDSSAVDFLYLGTVAETGSKINCINCNFINNQPFSEEKSVSDVAALYVYRSTLTLKRSNTFMGNIGGGLEVSQGIIFVEGSLEFINNSAINGGGVRLLNRATIICQEGTAMLFSNNMANQGGAIYATKSTLNVNFPILNRQCFLQYYQNSTDPSIYKDQTPSDWSINVTFSNNTDKDIYSTDFDDCRFVTTNASLLEDVPFNVFNFSEDKSPFNFLNSNDSQISDRLATDADFVNLEVIVVVDKTEISFSESTPIEVALGQTVTFRLSSFDEFGQSTTTVYLLEAMLNSTDLDVNVGITSNGFPLTLKDDQLVCKLEDVCESGTQFCSEHIQVDVTLRIPTTPIAKDVTLRVRQCNPGFCYNNLSKACSCQSHLYDIRSCENGYFYAYEGIYAHVPIDNGIVKPDSFVSVPVSYLSCKRAPCLVQFNQLQEQCAEGRKDLLCGHCDNENGYGVTMDLRNCYNCSQDKAAWGIVIFLVTCVGSVVFCIAVLYFNIGIPNELRGFLLFAQVIGLVYRNGSYFKVGDEFFNVLVNILSTNLPFPICMSTNITTTWMTVLGYVPSLIALVTVVTFVRSTYCIPRLANHSSIAGITLITLFVYKYLVDNSLILLSCVNVNNGNEEVMWVSRFSGELCYQAPYVVFFVLALITLIFLLVPFLFFIFAISIKEFVKTKHISDAMSKGIKPKFKWYAAWDLLRRLYFVVFAFSIPNMTPPHRLLAMALFEAILLIVHCLVKPYEKKWINFVETLILADLFFATIAILKPNDQYTQDLVILFVILPYLYAISMVLYLILKYIWDRHVPLKWRERTKVTLAPLYNCYMKMSNKEIISSQTKPRLSSLNTSTSTFYVSFDSAEPTLSTTESESDEIVFQGSNFYRDSLMFEDTVQLTK